MPCTHIDTCELYAQFALNPALQVWHTHYCNREHSRCVRYQMSLRKETVPLNLLPNGTKVEIPRSSNDYAATALFNAILKSRTNMVASMLKNNLDVNLRNSDGVTPLMAAASTGNLEIVKMLLANGADPTIVNNMGENAIDIAQRSQHAEAAQLLRAAAGTTSDQRASVPANSKAGGWLSKLRGN